MSTEPPTMNSEDAPGAINLCVQLLSIAGGLERVSIIRIRLESNSSAGTILLKHCMPSTVAIIGYNYHEVKV